MICQLSKGLVLLSVLLISACYSNPEQVRGPDKEKKTIEIGTSIFPKKETTQSSPVIPSQKKAGMPATQATVMQAIKTDSQVIERPKITGLAFTDAVMKVMSEEMDGFGGWRPNDLVFGRIWHNRKYEQLGKLEVVRHTVRVLKQDIARSGGMDKFDPHIAIAEADFWNDPKKFLFPSAESKYRNGVAELLEYRNSLERGDTKFYPRSDNLYRLVDQYIAILGDVHHQLMSRDVDYLEIDNIFFYSRGAASAMADILGAVEIDFYDAIEGRGLARLVRETIEPLEEAAGLKPLIVLNGDSDDIRANHRLNLAAYISDARTKLYAIAETLQK